MNAPDRRVGTYKLVHHLGTARCGERWLAVDEEPQTTHVLYWLNLAVDRTEHRRQLDRIAQLSHVHHPHVLRLESIVPAVHQGHTGAWIVTPYTGHHTGLVTLEDLLRDKGGTMPIVEVERSLLHLLQASEAAHEAGVCHGPLDANEIQVDRHGSVVVELYGVGRAISDQRATAPESIREEVRSLVALGYRLATGLPADEMGRVRVGRLIRRLDSGWDTWFDMGLDPSSGFQSAAEALGQLPSARGVPESVAAPITVRAVWSKLARAMGT